MKQQTSFLTANRPLMATMSVPNGEVGRLVSAAIVDRKFCRLLLADPQTAIESGFGREQFDLSPTERQLVLSVQNAASLSDFAWQLIENYNKTE